MKMKNCSILYVAPVIYSKLKLFFNVRGTQNFKNNITNKRIHFKTNNFYVFKVEQQKKSI